MALLLAVPAIAQTEISDVYQRQYQGETERRLLRLERGIDTVTPIVYGSTGETSAADAINALLPDQSTHSGEYLSTDGSVASWEVMSADYSEVFTVSGSPHTVTIPDGVDAVYVYGSGGGGSGCQPYTNTGNYFLGGGGGGAEYIVGQNIKMIAGNEYDITVGEGGAIGSGYGQKIDDRDGNPGENTTIETENGTITLTGGGACVIDTKSGASTGGAGASGAVSSIHANGGSGGNLFVKKRGGDGDSVGTDEIGTGGGGGGGSLGAGGSQVSAEHTAENTKQGYGGGGAGGYGSSRTKYDAGAGADGVVMLEYRFNHY